jgi:hypothetical protein
MEPVLTDMTIFITEMRRCVVPSPEEGEECGVSVIDQKTKYRKVYKYSVQKLVIFRQLSGTTKHILY